MRDTIGWEPRPTLAQHHYRGGGTGPNLYGAHKIIGITWAASHATAAIWVQSQLSQAGTAKISEVEGLGKGGFLFPPPLLPQLVNFFIQSSVLDKDRLPSWKQEGRWTLDAGRWLDGLTG